MKVLGTVTSRKNVGGGIELSIVGRFCRSLGSMSFIRTLSLLLRGTAAGASYLYFVSDTIYSQLLSMHGLDKVAHVSHVAGPASFRCIGRPAFPAVDGYLAPGPASLGSGWAPGSTPSTWDGRLPPQSRASSLGGGRRWEAKLRRPGFDFCRYLCFSVLALVLWDGRNGCSARLSESARAGLVARITYLCR